MLKVVAFLSKNKPLAYTLIGIIVLAVVYFWAKFSKSKREERITAEQQKKIIDQKTGESFNGNNVPQDFNAMNVVNTIYSAMRGWGTNEEQFFNVLAPLNKDQLIVVHNLFNATYGTLPSDSWWAHTNGYWLRDWIESEFSGADLNKALNIFSQVPNF